MIAADTFFPIIKQNFTVYQEFLKRSKPVEDETVSLVQAHHNSAYEGESILKCGLPKGKSKFAAYASRHQPPRYGLKIFASYFGDAPCFRFCSAGRSHFNPETGDGVEDISIRLFASCSFSSGGGFSYSSAVTVQS